MTPEATLKTKASTGANINTDTAGKYTGTGPQSYLSAQDPDYGDIIPSPFKSYPGGKEASGVPQTIINYIPEHVRYIEPFLGSGTIARWKKPAAQNFLSDIDKEVMTKWEPINRACKGIFSLLNVSWKEVIFLAAYKDTFCYLDPPYPGFVRSSSKRIYKHEMMTKQQHIYLLECWSASKSNVMISSYRNELYDEILKEWKVVEFDAMTRQGPRREAIYMNYDIEQLPLHDYRYLGADRRERERIRNKVKRWKDGLDRMERREREAILQYINKSPLQA